MDTPDSPPTSNSPIFAADYVSGTQIAFAILMALWHRNATGKGQFIEMAQAENAAAMLAQAYMNFGFNGVVEEAIGNRSIYAEDGEAPSGVYPCLPEGTGGPGNDRWIAITVTSDAQWQALRAALGSPEWAAAAELKTAAGRAAQHDLISRELAAWTRGFQDEVLFRRLQEAGVPAAPALPSWRVLSDPQLRARGLYRPQALEDDVGTYAYPGPVYDLPASDGGIRRAPVVMGQDNDYVYRELLGNSDEEVASLVDEGHIATVFDSSIP